MKLSLCGALALVALISAGAGATAGSLITSAQIQDHTIRVRDLAPSTLNALRGTRGARGLRGEPGPPGAAGPRGPEGPPIAANTTTVDSAPTTVEPSDYATAIATCPAGYRVTGGGWFTTSDDLLATASSPNGEAWRVRIVNLDTSQATFTTEAVCGYFGPT